MLSFFSGFAGRDEKDILQYSVNIIHLFQIDTGELNKYLWLSSEVWVALVSHKGDICFKAKVQLSLVSRLQKELNFSI